jgi:hypothetical protein
LTLVKKTKPPTCFLPSYNNQQSAISNQQINARLRAARLGCYADLVFTGMSWHSPPCEPRQDIHDEAAMRTWYSQALTDNVSIYCPVNLDKRSHAHTTAAMWAWYALPCEPGQEIPRTHALAHSRTLPCEPSSLGQDEGSHALTHSRTLSCELSSLRHPRTSIHGQCKCLLIPIE